MAGSIICEYERQEGFTLGGGATPSTKRRGGFLQSRSFFPWESKPLGSVGTYKVMEGVRLTYPTASGAAMSTSTSCSFCAAHQWEAATYLCAVIFDILVWSIDITRSLMKERKVHQFDA